MGCQAIVLLLSSSAPPAFPVVIQFSIRGNRTTDDADKTPPPGPHVCFTANLGLTRASRARIIGSVKTIVTCTVTNGHTFSPQVCGKNVCPFFIQSRVTSVPDRIMKTCHRLTLAATFEPPSGSHCDTLETGVFLTNTDNPCQSRGRLFDAIRAKLFATQSVSSIHRRFACLSVSDTNDNRLCQPALSGRFVATPCVLLTKTDNPCQSRWRFVDAIRVKLFATQSVRSIHRRRTCLSRNDRADSQLCQRARSSCAKSKTCVLLTKPDNSCQSRSNDVPMATCRAPGIMAFS